MKVLFLARSDIYKVSGGDTTQIEETAKELRKLGIDVDVSNTTNLSFDPYDLIHIFQLDWIPETYFYVKSAKKSGKKVVLSPIHHSEKEVKRFDDCYVFGLRKLLNSLVRKQEHRDILKNVFRGLFLDHSKLVPTIKGALLGYRRIQRKCLLMSDIVLVQTQKEAEDLKNTYNVDFTWVKIANGVSEEFFQATDYRKVLDFEDYLICVGRIEARKNQLSVIQAVKELRQEYPKFSNLRLVFLGRKSANHKNYIAKFDRCLKENTWLLHPGFIPQRDIPSYFHFAKVCVSASWFETTGLTSIEALFCNTNVVASGERASEVLGVLAEYCDPGDIESIKLAISKAYSRERVSLPDAFIKEYTWSNVAKNTLGVYNKLCN
jgi:glycosyltransferase involved in cell wall biosynthesis